MIAVKQFIAENAEQIALVVRVRVSGGKDSTRMLGFLRAQFPAIPTYCVMADTGFEHVRPVPAVDWSRQMAARFGLELHVVRNPNKTYLEMVRRRGKFPSAQFRQCTSDLKRGPIQKFIRQLPHRVVIHCMGMRAQESPQRARQQSWVRDESLSKAGRTVYNWLPIFAETTDQVLEWHWRNGVPLHPVYVPSTTMTALREATCVGFPAGSASLPPTGTCGKSTHTTGKRSTLSADWSNKPASP